MTTRSAEAPPGLKLYRELAVWWPLMSAPANYAEEAELFQRILMEHGGTDTTTLLELGSGGGNNASYLKSRFQMTLADCSPDMLEVSRALNPECEHVEGDMRTLRLGRRFDFVFVHDAIAYMASLADLRAAMETAFEHCEPGGVALFVPDHLRENFQESTDHGGHDGVDRSFRYLEWTWDPDPSDHAYVVDYAYLMREGDGPVQVETERHVEGLFARQEWLSLLAEVGFQAEAVAIEHSEFEPGQYVAFVGNPDGNNIEALHKQP